MGNFTLTNLFSTALADHNYQFLARDTDGSLYAFKSEPYFETANGEWTDDTSDTMLTNDAIDTMLSDWNLEHLIPNPSLIDYTWIKPRECVRI